MGTAEIVKLTYPVPVIQEVTPESISFERARDYFYAEMNGSVLIWLSFYACNPSALQNLKEAIAAEMNKTAMSVAAFQLVAKHGQVKIRTCFSCGTKFEHLEKAPKPACPSCGINNEEFLAST